MLKVFDQTLNESSRGELTRAIRGERELARVRIIILSSTPAATVGLDADAVLTKPFDMQELLAVVAAAGGPGRENA